MFKDLFIIASFSACSPRHCEIVVAVGNEPFCLSITGFTIHLVLHHSGETLDPCWQLVITFTTIQPSFTFVAIDVTTRAMPRSITTAKIAPNEVQP